MRFATPSLGMGLFAQTGDADRGIGTGGYTWDAYFAALARGERPNLPIMAPTQADINRAGSTGWDVILAAMPYQIAQLQQTIQNARPGDPLLEENTTRLNAATTILKRAQDAYAEAHPGLNIKSQLIPVLDPQGNVIPGMGLDPNDKNGQVVRYGLSPDQEAQNQRLAQQLQNSAANRQNALDVANINATSRNQAAQLSADARNAETNARKYTADLQANTAAAAQALRERELAVRNGDIDAKYAEMQNKLDLQNLDTKGKLLQEALKNVTATGLARYGAWVDIQKLDQATWNRVHEYIDNENTRRSNEARSEYQGQYEQRNTDVDAATKLAQAAKDIYVKQLDNITAPDGWFRAMVAGIQAVKQGRGLPNNWMQGVQQPTPPEDPIAFMQRARDAFLTPEQAARVQFKPPERLTPPAPFVPAAPPDIAPYERLNLQAAGIEMPPPSATDITQPDQIGLPNLTTPDTAGQGPQRGQFTTPLPSGSPGPALNSGDTTPDTGAEDFSPLPGVTAGDNWPSTEDLYNPNLYEDNTPPPTPEPLDLGNLESSQFSTPGVGGDITPYVAMLSPVADAMPPEYVPRAGAALAGVILGGDPTEEINYAFQGTGYQDDWTNYEDDLQKRLREMTDSADSMDYSYV